MERNTVRIWGGRLLLVAAACLGLLTLGVTSSFAQIDAGAVLGTVTDSSGGRISGAGVTLTNEGTNASVSTTTGDDGGYKFTPVRIGTYKVTVTIQGFQTTTQHSLVVNVGENLVADFSLKPGSVTETVEVTSSAPVLQSQDASVGQVIDSKNVNDLPLNGRNFTFLAQLSAGVNTPQADTRGNAASGAFAANGLRPAQNNYLLDGIDNNSDTVDFLNGTNFVVLPPVDAVAEFKVQTSGFSAEYGRSGAAVLNATIKSGSNEFHGAVWEFFRNDKLDAADWFENAGGTKKGALRQNQFGISSGGPVIKNKIFFFADYEGFRRRQGTVLTGTVPTLAERNSGYTDFSDRLGQVGSTRTDALGRSFQGGTIFDPATTRAVGSNFVRDPFLGNILPANRLDQNAIALLNLYPLPTSGAVTSNYTASPKLKEDRNAFDARMDINFNQNNQLFYRFSYVDDPILIPSIFGGVPDGGGFQQGNQTANAQQSALGYTHTFSPSLINEIRAGLNYLHTTRVSPAANDLSDLPGQFGVLGIPQDAENGGLPAFGIGGLQTLGSNAFLPSDEVSSTFQLTDNLTKIYGKHTFKMGFEWQHVKFSTLQPPWSRGQFNFDGVYTDIPNQNNTTTGMAQMLLIPATSSVGGPDYVGGPNNIFISNISLTDNGKNYYGTYFNDDWKLTNKLTLNLGLRWDYFQPVYEHHGNQANFIPGGPPTDGPMYLIPNGPNAGNLSSGCATCFTDLLAKDGIALVTGKYGKSLVEGQKHNFAPRVGFAYQANPKLVVRGGFGIFYNGFENRGFSPNIGENYPFQFNFNFSDTSGGALPVTSYAGCPTATPVGGPTLETGFSCTSLTPLAVNANGLALRGIQFDYITPYSMSGNLTVQYQLTPSMSVQAAYVTSLARHLEVFPGNNNVTSILPAGTDLAVQDNPTATPTPKFGNCPTLNFPGHACVPFPDFGRGSSQANTEGNSHYHALQTKVEKQFKGGLNFLATYTFSKVMTDANDLLNGGSVGVNNNGGAQGGGINGYRAPDVPGFGIQADSRLAAFDIRHVFHFSGSYELPFGKGRHFLSQAGGVTNQIVGGWQVLWIATLQGGQPIQLSCASQTASGLGCGALFTGEPLKLGLHDVTIPDSSGNPKKYLSWFGNPAAFTQACVLGAGGVPIAGKPAGCVPMTGNDALGGVTQVPGPGFHRLDFSIFKDFPIKERYRLQFRSEIFNIFNHPNFNAPGFGGNGVVAIGGSANFTDVNFGRIGSTRDAPYDARQIQFALKFYY
jgi:Carboxypeptidase regulatory-like domain/TonB dependent receptor-like, beta-barrel/TonB-dependent Receptor Plug Domain